MFKERRVGVGRRIFKEGVRFDFDFEEIKIERWKFYYYGFVYKYIRIFDGSDMLFVVVYFW